LDKFLSQIFFFLSSSFVSYPDQLPCSPNLAWNSTSLGMTIYFILVFPSNFIRFSFCLVLNRFASCSQSVTPYWKPEYLRLNTCRECCL
jgi:hypothetical protein